MKIKYCYDARRAGDLAEYYADPSRANDVLRWSAKRTVQDMVRSNWKYNAKLGYIFN